VLLLKIKFQEKVKLLFKKEYSTLQKKSDTTKRIVRKKIKCFIWKNQYFELVELIEPSNGMLFLR
jgi:hypothetical protein